MQLYETGKPEYAYYKEAIELAKDAKTIYGRIDQNERPDQREARLARYKDITNPLALLCFRYNKHAIENVLKHKALGPLFDKFKS